MIYKSDQCSQKTSMFVWRCWDEQCKAGRPSEACQIPSLRVSWRQLAAYYAKDPNALFMVRIAQGLVLRLNAI